jgi:hypothetical protein
MDPRSQRAKQMALDNLKLIEQLIQRLKQPEPTKSQPEEFYTVKEVDSPETDYSPR